MNKLTELFEQYVESFDNTEVTLTHGGYLIFESSSSSDVKSIKGDIEQYGYQIEKVGKDSYRFKVSCPKEKLQLVVNKLVERVA